MLKSATYLPASENNGVALTVYAELEDEAVAESLQAVSRFGQTEGEEKEIPDEICDRNAGERLGSNPCSCFDPENGELEYWMEDEEKKREDEDDDQSNSVVDMALMQVDLRSSLLDYFDQQGLCCEDASCFEDMESIEGDLLEILSDIYGNAGFAVIDLEVVIHERAWEISS